MLGGMRKHANSFVMSIMFGIIIIVFVFSFGPGSARYCGNELPMAARVNGRPIPAAEFQQEYAWTYDRMQRFRPNYTVETARAENLKQTVLDQLIGRELLAQEALQRGLLISDAELAREIMKTSYFQTEGKFDRDLYRRYATSLNLSEAAYEEDFRRRLMSDRMREVLTETVAVSEVELKQTWEQRNNRADLWVVRIDPFPFKTGIEVSDDDVKTFVSEQKARIEDFYNAQSSRYNQPEKVRVRHILKKVAEGASVEDEQKAREAIDAAKKRIDAGEDFATVARELSDDSSSVRGGDLGAQARGAWVKPFEEAAFVLEAGKVSDIVRSQFGFHIIKTEEHLAASTRTLDDAATEIAREILVDDRAKEKARLAANEWQVKLQTSDDPETLNPSEETAATAFAPKVEATGFFEMGTRYVPKVGVAPELATVAFKLTKESPTPDAAVEATGRFFAIKLKDRESPDPESFAGDKERIRSELMARQQMRVVDEFIKTLRTKAAVELNPSAVSYKQTDSNSES